MPPRLEPDLSTPSGSTIATLPPLRSSHRSHGPTNTNMEQKLNQDIIRLYLGICTGSQFFWQPRVPGTRHWVLLLVPGRSAGGTATTTGKEPCTWYRIIGGPKEDTLYQLRIHNVRSINTRDSLEEQWPLAEISEEKAADFVDVVRNCVEPKFSQQWVIDVLERLKERVVVDFQEGVCEEIKRGVQADPFEEGRDWREVMAKFEAGPWEPECRIAGSESRIVELVDLGNLIPMEELDWDEEWELSKDDDTNGESANDTDGVGEGSDDSDDQDEESDDEDGEDDDRVIENAQGTIEVNGKRLRDCTPEDWDSLDQLDKIILNDRLFRVAKRFYG